MLICELVSHRPSSGDQRFMFIVNLTVYTVFAIDYINEPTLTAQRGAYSRNQSSQISTIRIANSSLSDG
jgi:hypothetical protein